MSLNFCDLFSEIKDGQTVLLEKEKEYHLWEEDAIRLTGYYASNTASAAENPDGFRRCAIFLKARKDITIDGNGARLILHGIFTPFVFDRCENLTVKNLTVEYARPTMSEYTVQSCDDGICFLETEKSSSFYLDGNTLVWCGERGQDGRYYWENSYKNAKTLTMFYDPKTERSQFCRSGENDPRPSVPTFERVERIGERTLKVVFKNREACLPIGCVLQTRSIVRDQLGGLFVRCKDLSLENLRICDMHGFGLLAQFCDGVVYRRLDCTPKAGKTVACNADFFHFSGCKGRILIEDCIASGAHDDFINVHGTYLRVVERCNAENAITVRFVHSESWGFQAFEKGDTIEFTVGGSYRALGTAEVLSFERLNNTDIKLYLSGSIPEELRLHEDYVENVTATASVEIRNNRFGPSMGRGMLCTTRKQVVVENNLFYKTGHAVLNIQNDTHGWFESGTVGKFIFRNNQVIGCGYGLYGKNEPVVYFNPNVRKEDEESAGEIYGELTIENNRFEDAPNGEYEFYFGHTKCVVIRGNSFDREYKITANKVGCLIEKDNEQKDGSKK